MTDFLQYGPQNRDNLAAAMGEHPALQTQRPVSELELVPSPDTKAVRRTNQIERGEQIKYFNALRRCLDPDAYAEGLFVARPEFPGADMIYSVTNSNVAGEAVGKVLVATGVRRGYPDINIDCPHNMPDDAGGRPFYYHGARIELKRPQGVPSDVGKHQAHWHDRLTRQGYKCVVAYGWWEAWQFTQYYLGWDNA